MTGNISDNLSVFTGTRDSKMYSDCDSSFNRETHGNVCYTFHKQKTFSAVYSKRKISRNTEDRLFLTKYRVSIFKTMDFAG
jgi:hypothetical protein